MFSWIGDVEMTKPKPARKKLREWWVAVWNDGSSTCLYQRKTKLIDALNPCAIYKPKLIKVREVRKRKKGER